MEQQGTSTPGGAAGANPMPGGASADTSAQHLASRDKQEPDCGLTEQPDQGGQAFPTGPGGCAAAPEDNAGKERR